MSQDFSDFKLGKRAPIHKPALMLRDILNTGVGTMPTTPAAVDHYKQAVEGWELGDNYRFGTCGPTSVANHRRLVTSYLLGKEQAPTLQDVFDLYKRSGNPGFNPNLSSSDPRQEDNGVIMQEMLEALVAGGIGGVKPVAFAKIAPDDMDTLDRAIALFGGVLLGLSLDVAQQSQATWNHVIGSPEWGGHAVLAGKYSDPAGTAYDRVNIITWATEVPTTRSFINSQDDEAWVVIWPEMLQDKTFLEGVNLSALVLAYKDLTGRDLPLPSPAPVPAPAPVADSPDDDLAKALVRALKTKSALPSYVRVPAKAWLDAYGYDTK